MHPPHMIIVMHDLGHSYAKWLLHPGPRTYHNALVDWRHYDEFRRPFRICGDGVQSLGQARRPQRAEDVSPQVLRNWKICLMLLIITIHVTSSNRS
jgi:hypothetical protein